MKKRKKILATVVKNGNCRFYKVNDSFVLTGFTPRGICDSAYNAISKDAVVMAYGGKLPWEKDGKVLTHCPDPEGAVWELKIIDE